MVLGSAFAGCAAPAPVDDTMSSSDSALSGYRLDWNCNDGAMVIDTYAINADETRMQAVIRDAGVVRYFTNGGFSPTKPSSSGEFIIDRLSADSMGLNTSVTPAFYWLELERRGDVTPIVVHLFDGHGNATTWRFETCRRMR